MCLLLTVVRILTEDHGPDRRERRKPQRSEDLGLGRIDGRVWLGSLGVDEIDELQERRGADRGPEGLRQSAGIRSIMLIERTSART